MFSLEDQIEMFTSHYRYALEMYEIFGDSSGIITDGTTVDLAERTDVPSTEARTYELFTLGS